MGHKHGCLMALLPKDISREILAWSKKAIDKKHLAEEGLSDHPHITIKYGFLDSSKKTLKQLTKIVKSFGYLKARLKTMSLFEGNEEGDVLKVDIESPDLRRLNSIISRCFSCEDIHPKYRPHVTLAYLLPKYSKKYPLVKAPFINQDINITLLEFSPPENGASSYIRLPTPKESLGVFRRVDNLNGTWGKKSLDETLDRPERVMPMAPSVQPRQPRDALQAPVPPAIPVEGPQVGPGATEGLNEGEVPQAGQVTPGSTTEQANAPPIQQQVNQQGEVPQVSQVSPEQIIQQASQEISNPDHPIQKFQENLQDMDMGGGMVRTVMPNEQSPMSPQEHQAIAASHRQLSNVMAFHGLQDDAYFQNNAAQFHEQAGLNKAKTVEGFSPQKRYFHDSLMPNMKFSSSVPKEHIQERTQRMVNTLSRVPENAIQRISVGVSPNDVYHYSSSKEMVEYLKSKFPNEQVPDDPGGLYSWDSGRIDLDGNEDHAHFESIWGHEIGHALDQGGINVPLGGLLSESPEWMSIWEKDLKSGGLTPYAATDPQEGFAEFARWVYVYDVTPSFVMQQLPLVYDFWHKNGLLPDNYPPYQPSKSMKRSRKSLDEGEETMGRNNDQLPPDIFSGKKVLPDGTHVDTLNKSMPSEKENKDQEKEAKKQAKEQEKLDKEQQKESEANFDMIGELESLLNKLKGNFKQKNYQPGDIVTIQTPSSRNPNRSIATTRATVTQVDENGRVVGYHPHLQTGDDEQVVMPIEHPLDASDNRYVNRYKEKALGRKNMEEDPSFQEGREMYREEIDMKEPVENARRWAELRARNMSESETYEASKGKAPQVADEQNTVRYGKVRAGIRHEHEQGQKAMSWLNTSSGGALVPDAKFPKSVIPLKRGWLGGKMPSSPKLPRKKHRRKNFGKMLTKALGDEVTQEHDENMQDDYDEGVEMYRFQRLNQPSIESSLSRSLYDTVNFIIGEGADEAIDNSKGKSPHVAQQADVGKAGRRTTGAVNSYKQDLDKINFNKQKSLRMRYRRKNQENQEVVDEFVDDTLEEGHRPNEKMEGPALDDDDWEGREEYYSQRRQQGPLASESVHIADANLDAREALRGRSVDEAYDASKGKAPRVEGQVNTQLRRRRLEGADAAMNEEWDHLWNETQTNRRLEESKRRLNKSLRAKYRKKDHEIGDEIEVDWKHPENPNRSIHRMRARVINVDDNGKITHYQNIRDDGTLGNIEAEPTEYDQIGKPRKKAIPDEELNDPEKMEERAFRDKRREQYESQRGKHPQHDWAPRPMHPAAQAELYEASGELLQSMATGQKPRTRLVADTDGHVQGVIKDQEEYDRINQKALRMKYRRKSQEEEPNFVEGRELYKRHLEDKGDPQDAYEWARFYESSDRQHEAGENSKGKAPEVAGEANVIKHGKIIRGIVQQHKDTMEEREKHKE